MVQISNIGINTIVDAVIDINFPNRDDFNFFIHFMRTEYLRKKTNYPLLFIFGIIYLLILQVNLVINSSSFLAIFFFTSLEMIIFTQILLFYYKSQWKAFLSTLNAKGLLILNQIVTIIETTESLNDAIQFVSSESNYFFRRIFEQSLVKMHFGKSISESFIEEISENLFGDLKINFTNVIMNWDDNEFLADYSQNQIKNRLKNIMKEESDKIDSISAIFSGLIFLAPPVILTLLLIGGQLNFSTGCLINLVIVMTSILFSPGQFYSNLDKINPITSKKNEVSASFLLIFGKTLSSGENFTNSLVKSIEHLFKSEDKNNFNSMNFYSHLLYPGQKNLYRELLEEVLTPQYYYLYQVTDKMSEIDSIVAGKSLIKMVNEIININEVFNEMELRIKTQNFRQIFLKITSIICLGILGALNPIFLYVSNFRDYNQISPVFEPNQISSDVTLIFFISGLIIAFIPTSNKEKNASYYLISISSLLIFFLVFFLSQNVLT